MPLARVGVSLDAPLLLQVDHIHRLLLGSLLFAGTDSNYLAHEIHLVIKNIEIRRKRRSASDLVHVVPLVLPTASRVEKMVLGGLVENGRADGLQQHFVPGAVPEEGAQIPPGLILEAGLEKSGGGEAHPVAPVTELMGHGADEADLSPEAGNGEVVSGTGSQRLVTGVMGPKAASSMARTSSSVRRGGRPPEADGMSSIYRTARSCSRARSARGHQLRVVLPHGGHS